MLSPGIGAKGHQAYLKGCGKLRDEGRRQPLLVPKEAARDKSKVHLCRTGGQSRAVERLPIGTRARRSPRCQGLSQGCFFHPLCITGPGSAAELPPRRCELGSGYSCRARNKTVLTQAGSPAAFRPNPCRSTLQRTGDIESCVSGHRCRARDRISSIALKGCGGSTRT